ncbi:hypothetical protein NPIL_478251 [Nephila pilipes]|uniref:Uncharacterized protein n=1 Tax=Nephila pilipes TaxID=299642 RepID=A0A8X6UMR1_NEPPI|nr:hypothetical protein NPIL_478251 [Nephila pilipes]
MKDQGEPGTDAPGRRRLPLQRPSPTSPMKGDSGPQLGFKDGSDLSLKIGSLFIRDNELWTLRHGRSVGDARDLFQSCDERDVWVHRGSFKIKGFQEPDVMAMSS